ncbi:MAG: ABC transporter substrate-binding protein [Duncaniella sp.]|nr:ABC transporter substrate-binding protein [Muribaculum sp.]MCM1256076.1 ABC transporter substrate-binding protein [Duncaniella sp.]
MTIKPLFSLFLPMVLPLLVSCKGGNALVSKDGGDTIRMEYATNITMVKYDDYMKATVRNPWDTTTTLHTYLLVPDSIDLPANLPGGTVVRIPMESALIYSSVHNSLVSELGAIDAISGVCGARYIHQQDLADRISNGTVVDCGVSTSPNIEKIISLNPDGIMLSPFENSGSYGKVGKLGIPIIECADYMETSPLGRAEWMKFYGILFGKEKEADSMFELTKREYNQLKSLVKDVENKPKVLIDRLYGQSWHIPAANSTMGVFIKDAGGINPFDNFEGSGSVGLAGEQVLLKAEDADIWLIRYSQNSDKTLRELAADNAIYPQFKAFKDKRVYGCNTSNVFFYEEVPFHPQWLLKDMISIFHPELSSVEPTKQYYTEMQ